MPEITAAPYAPAPRKSSGGTGETARRPVRSYAMKRSARKLAFGSLAALLLAGCTTTYVSPVEVTRFLGDTPNLLGSGPIAIRPALGEEPNSWGYAAFHTPVAREQSEVGYTVVGAHSSQVAEISVERVVDRPGSGRSPVNVGVGGSTGSYGSGVGVGIGLDLTPRPAEQIDTQLRVVIKPTAGGDALWEGRARFAASANSEYGNEGAAAAKLADALFSGFPGRSGETIEVR